MAHPAGLEPATFSVETSRSIQLSYECIEFVSSYVLTSDHGVKGIEPNTY